MATVAVKPGSKAVLVEQLSYRYMIGEFALEEEGVNLMNRVVFDTHVARL
jgi:hypothetical protein